MIFPYISYMTNSIKYGCKLLYMSDSKYPKQCYKMLKHHEDNGRMNWASNVKELLFIYGFGFAWLSQEIGNVPHVVNLFKQRLIDNLSQDWHSDINLSSRCHHYKIFKSLLHVEKYLVLDLQKSFF